MLGLDVDKNNGSRSDHANYIIVREAPAFFLCGGTYFAFIHMLVLAVPELAFGRLQQPNTAFVDEHAGDLSGRSH
nr:MULTISPECIES: hypothetical protein [Pseudomonas]